LFVEELTKAVLEIGDHDSRIAAVLAASPAATLTIPATLHASLIARVDDVGGEAGIAGKTLDQRRAVAPAEPVQRHHRHIWLAAPVMLKFGAEGDDEQDRQPRYSIERQVEQLARGRVDPMRVLENHQNGPAQRQCLKLAQQSFEQFLAFALRAEVEVGAGIRQ
jgi:hypothetical protein